MVKLGHFTEPLSEQMGWALKQHTNVTLAEELGEGCSTDKTVWQMITHSQ